MRLVRVPLHALAAGERVLAAASAHYVTGVLRLAPGARFIAFDPETHLEAETEVLDAARVRVGELAPGKVVADAPLAIVYALAKGDKVDATIRDATELGATRIVLAETARSVVKTTDRIAQKRDRWQRIVDEAARQCGRADPPAIEGPLPWRDALAAIQVDAAFCLHPHATEPLGPSLLAAAPGASVAFAIGPEGGLADDEIRAASEAGFRPVTLGPFVLRTETVTAAVLGAVRILRA